MRSNSGKPLGIYVHIPFCKSKCEYCDFYSLGGSRDRRTTDQYLQALADHIRETGRLAPDYTVDTVYFGGGTPSFFGAENLEKILDELQKRFHFGADPEITLEANPDSVTPQGLKRLVRAGFNRISIGVQSDQDDMLKRLGRPHTYEQARMAVVRAREAGFANLSLYPIATILHKPYCVEQTALRRFIVVAVRPREADGTVGYGTHGECTWRWLCTLVLVVDGDGVFIPVAMLAVGNLAAFENNAADLARRLRVAGYAQLAAAKETPALRGVCPGSEQLVSIAVLRVFHTPIPLLIVPRLVRGGEDVLVGGMQLLVACN